MPSQTRSSEITTPRWLVFQYFSLTNNGLLCMRVGKHSYVWEGVSEQFADEIQEDLWKGFHQGRILRRIEDSYGKGRKLELKSAKYS